MDDIALQILPAFSFCFDLFCFFLSANCAFLSYLFAIFLTAIRFLLSSVLTSYYLIFLCVLFLFHFDAL